MVPAWRPIRGLIRSRPLIPVSLIFAAMPLAAILFSWIGGLSFWFKVVYSSSLLYILAIGLYAIGCPSLIRKYESEFDRISKERDAYLRSNPENRLEITLSQLDVGDPLRNTLLELSRERDAAIGSDREALASKLRDVIEPRWDDTVQRYLCRTYEEADVSRTLVRLLCIIAWGVGTLAASIVIIHRIVLVFAA
jgi:hypothetical protein